MHREEGATERLAAQDRQLHVPAVFLFVVLLKPPLLRLCAST